MDAADNETNVILGDLVQTKDLDLLACLDQPAEVINPGMIDVDVECIRKTNEYFPSHLG